MPVELGVIIPKGRSCEAIVVRLGCWSCWGRGRGGDVEWGASRSRVGGASGRVRSRDEQRIGTCIWTYIDAEVIGSYSFRVGLHW